MDGLAVTALHHLRTRPLILTAAGVARIASVVMIADLPILSIGLMQERVATPSHARCRYRTAPCRGRTSCRAPQKSVAVGIDVPIDAVDLDRDGHAGFLAIRAALPAERPTAGWGCGML
jgi:hypothetical protein